jgi:tetratricopeptide (TPR) repeat protein
MARTSKISDGKITVSARVSSAAVGILKEHEIPISDVIEAGIIHFLGLDDIDKVAYLLKNNSDVADKDDYKIPHATWPECIKEVLDLNETADVREEIKNFKAAAKWLPDKGASRIGQLSLKKLSAIEIVKKAADLMRTGRIPDALSYYDYAIMVCRKSENHREIGRVYLVMGDACRDIGNFSLALSAYEGAEINFQKDQTPQDIANLSYSRGVCFQLWGKHKESYGYFEKARNLFVSIGDLNNLHKTLSRLSLSLDSLEPEDSIKTCNEILEYFTHQKSQFTIKAGASGIG